uniref:ORF43j n=1 Tax=Pinus koraiensis TaxID=88728 RepID=A4QM58_PINKO|nr:ORF43j [Pinus koraiensis]ABP35395.1 ORF43j [Pinus koraiensis]
MLSKNMDSVRYPHSMKSRSKSRHHSSSSKHVSQVFELKEEEIR